MVVETVLWPDAILAVTNDRSECEVLVDVFEHPPEFVVFDGDIAGIADRHETEKKQWNRTRNEKEIHDG